MMLTHIKERQRGSVSSSTVTPVPLAYQGYGSAQPCGREVGARGLGVNGVVGGGAMPGPRYLLNMHPGVPVQVSRM